MKQKRKVKSLISSNGGGSLWLATLLFLLGGILVFGAVALFTSSVGVEAAGSEDEGFPGIDDKHEVLLNLGFIPYGGSDTVNEISMEGNTILWEGDKGISVDIGNTNDSDKYINYLGGDNGMNIGSDNITIIGGRNDWVYSSNDNSTIIGGDTNTVSTGANNEAAPVMLGGQNNKIGENQLGSAIVGGSNNTVGDNGSYDFILGGSDNVINGNKVIVGGARVKVNGKSNLFAFSYGDADFAPQDSNAFYLNLQKGLGLNKEAVNQGVDSNGAVGFGEINILSQHCTNADLGVQGTWKGCLVGCTATGVYNGKWEMVDHGEDCENYCKKIEYSNDCMINPIEPEKPLPYTSYCTTGGMDTGHSFHCGGEEIVGDYYQNVLFETTLIDSNDECPKPGDDNWTENRCVFKCEWQYHLTGDKTGGDGRTRCYKDCEMPWDPTIKIKHNETVTGYNTEETSCAFDADTPASPHTCANHKKTLMCKDGVLYLQKSNGQADTAHPAITDGYVYSGCMLHQYRCNTEVYNYDASDITNTNKFNDTVTTWGLTDRVTINGKRGKYKLCIDYNTNPDTNQQLNGEKCDALYLNTSVNPKRYTTHYKWVGCQPDYHTGAGYETVCMRDCKLDGKQIRHNQTMPAYKVKSPTCPNVCEEETFTCNDGHLISNKPGVNTGTYKYSSCSPKAVTCSTSTYNVSQSLRDAHIAESSYTSCQNYSVNANDKFHCTTGSTVYKISGCINNWHTENGNGISNKYCVKNDKKVSCRQAGSTATAGTFHYNVNDVTINWKTACGWKGSSSTCWETADACSWDCNSGYHKVDGDCISNSDTAECKQNGAPWCADYIVKPVSITYVNGGWTEPENCEYRIRDNYNEDCEYEDPYTPQPSVDGICGSGAYECIEGEVSGETSTSTEYQWVCLGSNGGDSSPLCTAPRSVVTNGQCAVTHYDCDAGESIYNDDSDPTKWTWTCASLNGGSNDPCVENKLTGCDVTCGTNKYECITSIGNKGPINPNAQGNTMGILYYWGCSNLGSAYGCPDGQAIPSSPTEGCTCQELTCESYQGYHSSHEGNCYNADSKDLSCGTTSTCYRNGCAANGYSDYTCYSSANSFAADEYDIKRLDYGYCVKEKPRVNVRYKFLNNSSDNIEICAVEGPDGVDYGLQLNGSAYVNPYGGTLLSRYSSYGFVIGKQYTAHLVFARNSTCDGCKTAGNCELGAYSTFTPFVGENVVEFDIGPTPSICEAKGCFESDSDCNAAYGHTGEGTVCYTDGDGCYCGGAGKCGTNRYECISGELHEEDSTDTHYKWSCRGAFGNNDSCSALIPKNGQCGVEHYSCDEGSGADGHEFTTWWTWTCEGVGGGDPDSCEEHCPAGQIIQNHECTKVAQTYYITPSAATPTSTHGEVDFEVTVNGEYTNLPNGVSLPIHLERTDNFGYYSADFNIPDGVSPDSVGVYRGFGGFVIANAGAYSILDIGFDNGYTKQTTINGDTYIINRNAVSKPKTVRVVINSSEVVHDMYGNECGLGFSLVGPNCGQDQNECVYDVDGSNMYVDVCVRGYGGGNAPSCTSYEYAGGQESAVEIKSVQGNFGNAVVGTTNKWNYDGDVVTVYLDAPEWCGNTPAPESMPACGDSLTNKCAIGQEEDYNSSTNTRNCVNSAGSQACKYSCFTQPSTYTCPHGYRLTSDNRCELYYQFCAEKIVCTEDLVGRYGCTMDNISQSPYNDACGASDGCFGDVNQGPYAHHNCAWGAGSLEWSSSWNPGAAWGGYEYYYLTPYEDYDASGPECGYNDVMVDTLLKKCRILEHENSQNGNGYVITRDSCAVTTYDWATPCVEGGSQVCSVMTL